MGMYGRVLYVTGGTVIGGIAGFWIVGEARIYQKVSAPHILLNVRISAYMWGINRVSKSFFFFFFFCRIYMYAGKEIN